MLSADNVWDSIWWWVENIYSHFSDYIWVVYVSKYIGISELWFHETNCFGQGDFYQRPFKEEYSEFETDMEKVAENEQSVEDAILGQAALCLL